MTVQRTIPPAAVPLTYSEIFSGIKATIQGRDAVEMLEQDFRRWLGVDYCSFVSSGKAALSLILDSLKSLNPRLTKVIVPTFTCFSVPSAIKNAGLEIVVCDINPDTYDFNCTALSQALEEPGVLCVVATHLFGLNVDVGRIRETIGERGIYIVEDAAQSFGNTMDDKPVGLSGDVGFYSLGRGKVLSAVEGGIIVTSDEQIHKQLDSRMESLSSYPVVAQIKLVVYALVLVVFQHPNLFWFPKSIPGLRLGETRFEPEFPVYRISAFQAGLLTGWKTKLERLQQIRKTNSQVWGRLFHSKKEGAIAPPLDEGAFIIRFPLRIQDPQKRAELLTKGERFGIMPSYPSAVNCIEDLKGEIVGTGDAAQSLADELITLPVHGYLNAKDRQSITCLLLQQNLCAAPEGRNKKVLMMSYLYPPVIASGCVRVKRFVENLPLFGYEPLVLTTKNPEGSTFKLEDEGNIYRAKHIKSNWLRIPDGIINRLMTKLGIGYKSLFFDRVFLFPDSAIGFVPAAVMKGFRLLRQHPVDLLYVTCKPFSTAFAAIILKRLFKLPLIVDFRDPYAYDRHKKVPLYYEKMRIWAERFVLNRTDCLVINTVGGKDVYAKQYPDLEIVTINNGFDVRSQKADVSNECMTISHVGSLYGLRRDPERLFAAMARLGAEDILFQSVGDTYPLLHEKAKKHGVSAQVQLLPSVPHAQALEYIRNSDVLFLTQVSEHDAYYSISIANKTFEYLEAGKPILADMPEGDNADIIKHYSVNSHVITDMSEDAVFEALEDLYKRWKSGSLTAHTNKEFIDKYNGKALTEKLAHVFDRKLAKDTL